MALTNVSASLKGDFKPGFNGGLFYSFQFQNDFLFSAGIVYQQRGLLLNIIETDSARMPLRSYNEARGYKFIGTPIKIGFKTKNPFYFLGQLGFIPTIFYG